MDRLDGRPVEEDENDQKLGREKEIGQQRRGKLDALGRLCRHDRLLRFRGKTGKNLCGTRLGGNVGHVRKPSLVMDQTSCEGVGP